MSNIAAQTMELIKSWREDNMLYLSQQLGVTKIWSLQEQLLKACYRAIAERKAIYVASGHSLGKDYICGAIASWFLDCWIPSKVILTAPSDRQVKKIMWAETLGHWQKRKVDLWGKAYTNPYIEIRQSDWFLLGFATKDTGAAAAAGGGKFQGLRASENMCVIVTEAQAIEDPIYDQIDAAATAANRLVIYLGNPTRATGRFAKGLKDKINNIVFNFSCLDNPNYKHRNVLVPGLADYDWVEDKRRRWGESDPRWIGRVLGQVPDNALNNVFPESWINHACSRRGFIATHVPIGGVAVDSAGEGVDENVIMAGIGGEVTDVYTRTLMSPTEVAIKAVDMCRAVDGHFIVFDCDGVGIRDYQEACSLPDDYLRGITLIKFHGSGKCESMLPMPDGSLRPVYCNLRTEAAFITQRRGSEGRASLNQSDVELIEDLSEDTYFENKRGLLQLDEKGDIKERLGRSPGRGDAYKMLQWGFEQEFEDRTYSDTQSNRLPQYGLVDKDIEANSVYYGSLPKYGSAG